MRNAGWWRTAALVAVLTACGPSTPIAQVSNSPSASAAASPSGTPAPAAGVCDATHRCLALVTLRGSNSIVVRDVTDINHAITVTNVGISHNFDFASATQLSYVDADGLFVAPLSGSPTTRVATSAGMGTFAWGPDGRVAYLAGSSDAISLHQVAGGKDTIIASGIPPMPGVGCETQFCSGADTWDVSLAYSPDGRAISLVLALPGVNVFRIWAVDGKALDASDANGRFMSTWSGEDLYFRDDKTGVLVWRNGNVSTFMPSSQWIHPQASPAGGQILYSTKDRQGWHHVLVVDTPTAQTKEIKKGRFDPRYLTARYVWYRGERACTASDHCPQGWTVVDSGKAYIYDLQTGVEYDSIITNVYDVWPHSA